MRGSATFTTAILVASALAAPRAVGPSAQRATVERHVFVRVTDAKSQPVSGLTPADFSIREDNLAVVSTLNDVVGMLGQRQSRESGHGAGSEGKKK